jgi:hypothetical protein
MPVEGSRRHMERASYKLFFDISNNKHSQPTRRRWAQFHPADKRVAQIAPPRLPGRRSHWRPNQYRNRKVPVVSRQHDTRRPNSNPPNNFSLLSPKTHQTTPDDRRQRLASSSVCGRRLRRPCRSPLLAAAAPSSRFGGHSSLPQLSRQAAKPTPPVVPSPRDHTTGDAPTPIRPTTSTLCRQKRVRRHKWLATTRACLASR